MNFWIREANLIIGKNKYDLDGLDFSFDVPFEDSDEPTIATVTIVNLADETRANIKKNDDIILNAGYRDNIGCILVGKVVGLKHKHSGTEWISTLSVQPCADEILGKIVNKTYVQNSQASTVVKDLLNIFGVEVSKCELEDDLVYPRGRVCRGNLKQVLTEIIVTECKSRFIIRPTGVIYITKTDDAIDNGHLLNAEKGLLKADIEKIAIPLETKLNSQIHGEKRDVETITRACLLNPHISTAELIKVQSRELNGKFVVVKGCHKGSKSGEWKTIMELKPS